MIQFLLILLLSLLTSISFCYDTGWHLIGNQDISSVQFLDDHPEVDKIFAYNPSSFLIQERVSLANFTSLNRLSQLTANNGYWIFAAPFYQFSISNQSKDISIAYQTNELSTSTASLSIFYSLDNGKTFQSSNQIEGNISNLNSNSTYNFVWKSLEEIKITAQIILRLDTVLESQIYSSYTSPFLVMNQAPSPPSNLTLLALDSQIQVSYDSLENADYYTVYFIASTSPPTSSDSSIQVIGQNQVTLSNLINEQIYSVAVSTTFNGIESLLSGAKQASPISPIPDPPTNLAATIQDQSILLTFTGVSGASEYFVYYRVGNVSLNKNDPKLSSTTTQITISSLNNGQIYTFAVSAVKNNQESNLSGVIA
ncbi:fibronectin type III domain-containing protein [bacterium]|nr:fibronectin type III domain-containing protein [bacterium]